MAFTKSMYAPLGGGVRAYKRIGISNQYTLDANDTNTPPSLPGGSVEKGFTEVNANNRSNRLDHE